MTRPRHQSKVGERGVDFSCPRCHVAGVKNSIPVWGRTESGYICVKEKPWEVASRDDPARWCQESLTSGQDGLVQTGRIQCGAERFPRVTSTVPRILLTGKLKAITIMCGGPRKERYIWHTISNYSRILFVHKVLLSINCKISELWRPHFASASANWDKAPLHTRAVDGLGNRERQPDYACANIQTLATHAGKRLMRVIVVYDDHALVDRTCQKWFARFKSSNFDLEYEERPGALLKLDDDPTQTQKELTKTLGVTQPAILLRLKKMIRRVGNWVPCELKPRDAECRFSREKLLQQRVFLHRIVSDDEKWVHYDYPKRWTTYEYPGRTSSSTAKLNIYGRKIMLCIWWDQLGVAYYELLQPNERITGEVY
ncbi:hypothetical protein LAZ67_12003594 [Cordylochernes scorpioides]|uniref:Mariner Mos1 transposase n=1 Tax=Cordylochernes scorpioides TaxID=51811 RepID=A0ABY6L6G1_9ARAC|nr:hypothetical protein LAZ67_12003594 [Cordylochernes scorpioides]